MILKNTPDILGSLERGALSKDFATAMQEVLHALEHLQKGKGSITLKLNFNADNGVVQIASTIATSIPKAPRKTSNYFITDDGYLSMQHPDQVDIFTSLSRSHEDA